MGGIVTKQFELNSNAVIGPKNDNPADLEVFVTGSSSEVIFGTNPETPEVNPLRL